MKASHKLGWLTGLLALLVVVLPHTAPVFSALFPELAQPVYTQESFDWLLLQHGWIAGGWLGAARLVRCQPLGKAGFDPVPETFLWLGSRVQEPQSQDAAEVDKN